MNASLTAQTAAARVCAMSFGELATLPATERQSLTTMIKAIWVGERSEQEATALRLLSSTRTYTSGVALINAGMARKFGKDRFVLVRGAGYYYWSGSDDRAYRLPSIYASELGLHSERDREHVLGELQDAINAVEAM